MLHNFLIMTYSKIHKLFSNYLKQPDALKNPEKYLGPNYKDVLNFWIYLDTLSKQEREEITDRFLALGDNVRIFAENASFCATKEVVGWRFREAAWWAARGATGRWVFGYATYELIAHHKLLEQNQTPLALQYCTKP
jgi:hypothetical protein